MKLRKKTAMRSVLFALFHRLARAIGLFINNWTKQEWRYFDALERLVDDTFQEKQCMSNIVEQVFFMNQNHNTAEIFMCRLLEILIGWHQSPFDSRIACQTGGAPLLFT